MGCTVLQTTVIDDCHKHVCNYDFAWWCSLNHSRRESTCLQQYSVITVCIQWAATHYSSPDTLNWTLHCVSKNFPPLVCYNFDIREHIFIFFGRSVTDKVSNQKTFYCTTSNNMWFCTIWQMRKHKNCIFSLECCISALPVSYTHLTLPTILRV